MPEHRSIVTSPRCVINIFHNIINLTRIIHCHVDKIAAESENDKILLHRVDLSSLQSVRKFCAKIIDTETKIDILIHNAGYYGGFFNKAVSVDGIEYTMATNYYGPFLMTILLMDLLRKSAPCRIVMVGSKIHSLSFLNPTVESHLNPISYWNQFSLYCNSKFAGILFTFELARRLTGSGVTVNALHPGSVDTEIWRNYSFPMNIVARIFRIFMKPLEEGIQTILFVALSTNLGEVSGKYFRDCRSVKAHKNAYNEEWQKIMWEESKHIAGVRSDDPVI